MEGGPRRVGHLQARDVEVCVVHLDRQGTGAVVAIHGAYVDGAQAHRGGPIRRRVYRDDRGVGHQGPHGIDAVGGAGVPGEIHHGAVAEDLLHDEATLLPRRGALHPGEHLVRHGLLALRREDLDALQDELVMGDDLDLEVRGHHLEVGAREGDGDRRHADALPRRGDAPRGAARHADAVGEVGHGDQVARDHVEGLGQRGEVLGGAVDEVDQDAELARGRQAQDRVGGVRVVQREARVGHGEIHGGRGRELDLHLAGALGGVPGGAVLEVDVHRRLAAAHRGDHAVVVHGDHAVVRRAEARRAAGLGVLPAGDVDAAAAVGLRVVREDQEDRRLDLLPVGVEEVRDRGLDRGLADVVGDRHGLDARHLHRRRDHDLDRRDGHVLAALDGEGRAAQLVAERADGHDHRVAVPEAGDQAALVHLGHRGDQAREACVRGDVEVEREEVTVGEGGHDPDPGVLETIDVRDVPQVRVREGHLGRELRAQDPQGGLRGVAARGRGDRGGAGARRGDRAARAHGDARVRGCADRPRGARDVAEAPVVLEAHDLDEGHGGVAAHLREVDQRVVRQDREEAGYHEGGRVHEAVLALAVAVVHLDRGVGGDAHQVGVEEVVDLAGHDGGVAVSGDRGHLEADHGDLDRGALGRPVHQGVDRGEGDRAGVDAGHGIAHGRRGALAHALDGEDVPVEGAGDVVGAQLCVAGVHDHRDVEAGRGQAGAEGQPDPDLADLEGQGGGGGRRIQHDGIRGDPGGHRGHGPGRSRAENGAGCREPRTEDAVPLGLAGLGQLLAADVQGELHPDVVRRRRAEIIDDPGAGADARVVRAGHGPAHGELHRGHVAGGHGEGDGVRGVVVARRAHRPTLVGVGEVHHGAGVGPVAVVRDDPRREAQGGEEADRRSVHGRARGARGIRVLVDLAVAVVVDVVALVVHVAQLLAGDAGGHHAGHTGRRGVLHLAVADAAGGVGDEVLVRLPVTVVVQAVTDPVGLADGIPRRAGDLEALLTGRRGVAQLADPDAAGRVHDVVVVDVAVAVVVHAVAGGVRGGGRARLAGGLHAVRAGRGGVVGEAPTDAAGRVGDVVLVHVAVAVVVLAVADRVDLTDGLTDDAVGLDAVDAGRRRVVGLAGPDAAGRVGGVVLVRVAVAVVVHHVAGGVLVREGLPGLAGGLDAGEADGGRGAVLADAHAAVVDGHVVVVEVAVAVVVAVVAGRVGLGPAEAVGAGQIRRAVVRGVAGIAGHAALHADVVLAVLAHGTGHGETGARGADEAGLTGGLALDDARAVDAGLALVAAGLVAGLELTDAEVLRAAVLVVTLAVSAGDEGPAAVGDEAAAAVSALGRIVADGDAEEDGIRVPGLLDALHVLRAVPVVRADLGADRGIRVQARGAFVTVPRVLAGGPDGALGHTEVLEAEIPRAAEAAIHGAARGGPAGDALDTGAGVHHVRVDLEHVEDDLGDFTAVDVHPGDVRVATDVMDRVRVGRRGIDGVSSLRTAQGEEPEAEEKDSRKRRGAESLHC